MYSCSSLEYSLEFLDCTCLCTCKKHTKKVCTDSFLFTLWWMTVHPVLTWTIEVPMYCWCSLFFGWMFITSSFCFCYIFLIKINDTSFEIYIERLLKVKGQLRPLVESDSMLMLRELELIYCSILFVVYEKIIFVFFFPI